MTNNVQIEEFWKWFQATAPSLAADIENSSLIRELDERVRDLDSQLSWEVGPGSYEPWQFVISPNLDRDLRTRARQIIARAPVIQGWEFHAARRQKEWDYKLVIQKSDGSKIQLDTSEWGFVLLEYPDGTREVLLQASGVESLDDSERWQAAALTLESILGEDVVLDRVDQFELVDQLEPRFAEKRKPIRSLREAIASVH